MSCQRGIYLTAKPECPTVTETLIPQILSLIREASLKPGDQLPSEKEIIAATNAIHPSVREALRAPKAMGIITTRLSAGSLLHEPEPTTLLRSTMMSVTLTREGLRDSGMSQSA